jgi:hypothetical protein
MGRFATNSWQAREALVERSPYTTGGAMSATGAKPLPWNHRLPHEWAVKYATEYDHITYVVWSYNTPIAWVLDDDSVVKVDHKWSITTSGHQGMLYALDANQETRAGIVWAAQRERQAQRDRRAQRSARELYATGSNLPAREDDIPWSNAMTSAPQDYDTLINDVQGMLVR